jgi:hypothetical protein
LGRPVLLDVETRNEMLEGMNETGQASEDCIDGDRVHCRGFTRGGGSR